MLMIVGLGNPGRKYSGTRHNIGFMVLDELAANAGVEFRDSKWDAQLVRTSLDGTDVLLVKPMTFMNRSGTPVRAISSYYQVDPGDIVVIHDDLDLEAGRLKMVYDRGTGGHNGIRSIVEHLGTNGFVRIRVGIGRPPVPVPAAAFVLSSFSGEELDELRPVFRDICEGLGILMNEGIAAATARLNTNRNK